MNKLFEKRWAAIGLPAYSTPPISGISKVVTQPDEAKPLKRMLEMMASGIPVPERQGNVYGDNAPDFFKMDSAEILMHRHETADKIDALKEQQQQIASALAQATEAEKLARFKSSKANASPVGDAQAASDKPAEQEKP